MAAYAKRFRSRENPSEHQLKFLESLRALGPLDNAQTSATRKATKRACQMRGWVEWRSIDGRAGTRAWHRTLPGRHALKGAARGRDGQIAKIGRSARGLGSAFPD